MGSSIYTRGGDKGNTSLVNGQRIPKYALRVEAYGQVDEANSWIGLVASKSDDPFLCKVLTFMQNKFFNCSSTLATPEDSGFEPPLVKTEDVEFLENAIDQFESHTGALKNFIIPGGSEMSAKLHIARTVCRRAERNIVRLASEEPIDETTIKFVNRSSDCLFAAARYANYLAKVDDVKWDKEFPVPDID